MSRVQLIEQLYAKRKSALEFDYDNLWAPPIRLLFTPEDINELIRIATSIKYNADIEKKYELIDAVMSRRGFKKAHSGTNRVVYNFLEDKRFVAKVAVDRVGMGDSPAEFKNQEYFKPFCCKIFEVHPSGVIAFVERVNPITSLEEFCSVADDVFNLMVTKIIGKYVVDDLGVKKYMNYGLRYNANGYTFGPVIIDFPYAYEVDGAKLYCNKPIIDETGPHPCGGEIDYDDGFNNLYCTKCGRQYKAMDLKKNDKDILIMYSDNVKGAIANMRSRIVAGGRVIVDSGYSSDKNITKESFGSLPQFPEQNPSKVREVGQTIVVKHDRPKKIRQQMRSDLLKQQYDKMKAKGIFDYIDKETTQPATASKKDMKPVEEVHYTSTPRKLEPLTRPVGVKVLNRDKDKVNYIEPVVTDNVEQVEVEETAPVSDETTVIAQYNPDNSVPKWEQETIIVGEPKTEVHVEEDIGEPEDTVEYRSEISHRAEIVKKLNEFMDQEAEKAHQEEEEENDSSDNDDGTDPAEFDYDDYDDDSYAERKSNRDRQRDRRNQRQNKNNRKRNDDFGMDDF